MFKGAFGIVILSTNNWILNQIAENESFGITFLKNCYLKTQKICLFKLQENECFFENPQF
jgi:hypothetical protein